MMIHKKCGGVIALDGDAYRCNKCGRGYKCVGQEHYLDEVVEPYLYEERAGIMEFQANLPRKEAERLAKLDAAKEG